MQKHPWCRDEGHDDRWCSTCDILWDGTEYGEGRYDELAAENKQQAKRIEELERQLRNCHAIAGCSTEGSDPVCYLDGTDCTGQSGIYAKEHSKGGKDVDKG